MVISIPKTTKLYHIIIIPELDSVGQKGASLIHVFQGEVI